MDNLRYAAIDTGSNAIRLLIADVVENSGIISFKKTLFIRIPLRLGSDSFEDQKISDNKAKDLVRTMNAFSYLMKVFKVKDYMACATSAMREAHNGLEIIKKIKKKTNINLKIIDGQYEAGIIYAIHAEQRLQQKKNYLYIDVGGGSTQLTFFSGDEMIDSRSFNIGTIRILNHQDHAEQWAAMRKWINKLLSDKTNTTGVGTGGNINKIHQLADKKSGKPISFDELKNTYSRLTSYSLDERITILGLNEDRADVIIPASEIYLKVMKWANINNLLVPRLGLVDGMIHQLVERNG